MKKIVTIFFLVIVLNSNASDKVRLNFFVKNGVGKEIVVKVFNNYITRDTWNYTCEIDSSGWGVISFKLDRPRETFFQADRNYFLFLTPGDNLDIEFDYQNPLKTIVYKGKGAVHCNFILEYRRNYHDRTLGKTLFKTGVSTETFTSEINKRWKESKDFCNEYMMNHEVSEPFRFYAQGLIDYSSIKIHLMHFLRAEKTTSKIQNPKEYYSFISPEYFQNDSVLKYGQKYLGAVSFWVPICEKILQQDPAALKSKQKLNGFDNKKGDSLSYFYKRYYYCLKEGNTRNYLIARYLFRSYGDDILAENNYHNFKSKCTDKELLDILAKAFAKYKDAEIPKSVLNTKLVSIQGKEISFKKLLSKHKGKVIYIDFWSTYCNPCLKEMPFIETLRKNVENLPVEVISLSLDKDYNGWKNYLARSNVKMDNHYVIKDSFQSELCDYYSINAIPRFFIIDTKSKIVTAKAPRASNPEIKGEIISLINLKTK